MVHYEQNINEWINFINSTVCDDPEIRKNDKFAGNSYKIFILGGVKEEKSYKYRNYETIKGLFICFLLSINPFISPCLFENICIDIILQ